MAIHSVYLFAKYYDYTYCTRLYTICIDKLGEWYCISPDGPGVQRMHICQYIQLYGMYISRVFFRRVCRSFHWTNLQNRQILRAMNGRLHLAAFDWSPPHKILSILCMLGALYILYMLLYKMYCRLNDSSYLHEIEISIPYICRYIYILYRAIYKLYRLQLTLIIFCIQNVLFYAFFGLIYSQKAAFANRLQKWRNLHQFLTRNKTFWRARVEYLSDLGSNVVLPANPSVAFIYFLVGVIFSVCRQNDRAQKLWYFEKTRHIYILYSALYNMYRRTQIGSTYTDCICNYTNCIYV